MSGWLKRVFGTNENPRGEGSSMEAEAVHHAAIIRQLEEQIGRLGEAHAALDAQHRAVVDELEAVRGELTRVDSRRARAESEVAATRKTQAEQLPKLQSDAAKLALLAATARTLEEQNAALTAEVAAQGLAKSKADAEVNALQFELTAERSRTASAQVSQRDATTAAARVQAKLQRERDVAVDALRAEKDARDAERAQFAKESASYRDRVRTLERTQTAAQGALREEEAAREADRLASQAALADAAAHCASLEREAALALDALGSLVERATDAVSLVLGREAPMAIRNAPSRALQGDACASLRDAVAAIRRGFSGARWSDRVSIDERDGEIRIAIRALPSIDGVGERAVAEAGLAAWLATRVGTAVVVTVDDVPSDAGLHP